MSQLPENPNYSAGGQKINRRNLLVATGVAATAAVTRDAVRTAVGLGAATSLMQVFTIHILIPVMPHNVAHQEAHDLLSLLAVICCAVALSVLRPAVKIDEVLDAAAADEQPDVDGDEAPDTPEAPAQQPPT